MIYSSAGTYFNETGTDIKARIIRMIAVRNAMDGALLNAAGLSDIAEYFINDGQTIIKATHRSIQDIQKSIELIDKMIAKLTTQINGRQSQLIDSKNLTGYGYGY